MDISTTSTDVTPLVRLCTTNVANLDDAALAAYIGDMRALRQSAPTRKSVVKGEGKAPEASKVQTTINKFL